MIWALRFTANFQSILLNFVSINAPNKNHQVTNDLSILKCDSQLHTTYIFRYFNKSISNNYYHLLIIVINSIELFSVYGICLKHHSSQLSPPPIEIRKIHTRICSTHTGSLKSITNLWFGFMLNIQFKCLSAVPKCCNFITKQKKKKKKKKMFL